MPSSQPQSTKHRARFDIPRPLYNEFSEICLTQGYTRSEIFRSLLYQYVQKKKKQKRKLARQASPLG